MALWHLKGHLSDTGPVLGLVVPNSLSWLELDRDQLQIPGKQHKPPITIVTLLSETLSIGVVKESKK